MSGVLQGKVTVVTGAARGLGRAVAKAYAAEGAVVYALDVLEDEVATLATEPGDLRPGRLDLADPADIEQVMTAIEAEAGRVDVLVNNAGIIFFKPVEEVSLADWDLLMNINLRGAFLCCRAVAPGMKARRSGAIINVSSNAGIKGDTDESTYCASKFGLEGLSRALAVEFAPYNVSVNSITPGHPMHTAMSEITYSAELRKIWKDPIELTPAFVHLALQDASGITDQRIRAWDMVVELGKGG
ncbi:3alpha(or 20beta)-hydroxysteroid dehydrogenase/3-oxoacyl-[acyl-carrier protein] reductase [Rhizobium sp. RU35A]|uniref:SDR family NAD(P)-dependent oxidoreductase n=1 Tax=Rhizobium sp. RU35A TaxID=1907414 RepID=UPI00095548F1|nr:SDR family oxidoreductase [Rhizobium sp. RU35A]SIQ46169.1 3alpha(or 20beta)-hydroxysteroid dehydrogenase/3-oxoacyl-[acyl-carrier protein] reductase [Rhizobium sp. RU35A]